MTGFLRAGPPAPREAEEPSMAMFGVRGAAPAILTSPPVGPLEVDLLPPFDSSFPRDCDRVARRIARALSGAEGGAAPGEGLVGTAEAARWREERPPGAWALGRAFGSPFSFSGEASGSSPPPELRPRPSSASPLGRRSCGERQAQAPGAAGLLPGTQRAAVVAHGQTQAPHQLGVQGLLGLVDCTRTCWPLDEHGLAGQLGHAPTQSTVD
mmetsp:Transcript_111993/g.340742  ORF Transcript_111993/g.340742 Transcript_111993/m.340742 type:complete len:211 (-) Transcript_111993:89-721(-)